MTAATPPPLGVTFASLAALGTPRAPEVARAAEALGYDSFWAAEVTFEDAFTLLAAAGAAAPGLGLGTGVVALQLRTPPLAAMAAATLQALHPEREIVLGFGISSPVVVGRWHGAAYGTRPIAQVREYLGLVRQCLSGEAVSVDGEFWSVSRFRLGVRLGERRPRLVVGALNPHMLALAGELADGVLLNYLPATHVEWSVAEVRKGEAAAGREPGSCAIYAYVHAGVGDPEQSRALAQRDLFSYGVVDAYARSFERAGFGDEIAALRKAHEAGDRDAAVAAISPRMCDAINIVGDAATVCEAVAAYRAAGVDRPVLMPLPWGEDRWATTMATLEAAIGA